MTTTPAPPNMTMTVYHRKPVYGFPVWNTVPDDLGWPEMYTPVAAVTGGDFPFPGLAYAATQSKETEWWKYHTAVWYAKKLTPGPCRSTAVGDVIVCGQKLWVVADAGFVLAEQLQEAVA